MALHQDARIAPGHPSPWDGVVRRAGERGRRTWRTSWRAGGVFPALFLAHHALLSWAEALTRTALKRCGCIFDFLNIFFNGGSDVFTRC